MTGRGKPAKCRIAVKSQTDKTSSLEEARAHDFTPEKHPTQTPVRAPNAKCARGQRAQSPVQRQGVPNPSTRKGEGARRKSLENPRRPESPQHSISPPPQLQQKHKIKRGDSTTKNPGTALEKTLDQLKIKRSERSEASKIKNEVLQKIKAHLEMSTDFKGINTLPTGSYFENLKIGNPDEFDVMFTIRVDRVDVQRFGSDGAYYSVKFKRHPKHVLDQFLLDDLLCASEMLKKFRSKVKDAMKTINIEGLKMEPKKANSPAVTLTLEVKGREISIDLVLSLEVHGSWPSFAKEGMRIENWLGTKVKKEYRLKPYYLVPKRQGCASRDEDGVCAKDVWRISFSHVEKAVMNNHGSEKTCCEENGSKCCRKQCLKLLKHLLANLKAKHPSELSKFCSYHAKTTLLHACTERTKDADWKLSDLHRCFQLLLEDFVKHLKNKELPNFFIPQHNLLGSVSAKNCRSLADYIEYECNNGFPIFETGV